MSIYKQFCRESFGEDGRLKHIEPVYGDSFNFAYDVVDAIAAAEPHKRAMVWCNTEGDERSFSFGEIRDESNRVANVLSAEGIKKGDKVMVILKRHYEYWFAALALHRMGVTMIPATHMLTASDYAYRMESSKAQAVICTPGNQVPSKIKKALEVSGVQAKLWCVREGAEGFDNLTEAAKAASSEFHRIETSVTDPMLLYFTSGTTGNPKGVVHDFSYPLAHIVTAKYWQGAEDGGLHFTVAETGWAKASWGKIYGQWLAGSAVMVYDFDNFDPKQLINVINRYGVTSFCAPPTVYRYLVRKGVPGMPGLRHASTAGETLAPEIFKMFTEKTGLRLCEGYGQTETALLAANFIGEDPVPGALGRPSPLYDVRVLGPDGKELAPGEIGEIAVVPSEGKRPIGVFCSYLGNDSKYGHVWRDGIYHTGDAAYKDEEGRLWFHGRFDDIIKTGGFRVGPYEVENVLSGHPAVLECSVIGVPDSLRGQAIKAVIVLNSGYEESAELEKEIKDFCNARLAEYKWVRMVKFTSEMPKTISGKIRKTELRKEG